MKVTIGRIEPIALRLPLAQPLKRATGTTTTADNLLVRIEGDYFGQQDETLLDDAVRMRGRAIDPLEEAEQKEREKRRPGGGG